MRKLEFIIILLLLLGSLWGQSSDIDAILQKAKSGDAESQYDLAMCYQYGEGLPQDLKEAAYSFTLSSTLLLKSINFPLLSQNNIVVFFFRFSL